MESEKKRIINDKYILIEIIGKNAWSKVYKAEDKDTKKLYAVKLLNPDIPSLKKIDTLAKLSSRNIIILIESGKVPSKIDDNQTKDRQFVVLNVLKIVIYLNIWKAILINFSQKI